MTTIAVFGATGRTGKPFTRLALEKGYHVRAVVPTRFLETVIGERIDRMHRTSNDQPRLAAAS